MQRNIMGLSSKRSVSRRTILALVAQAPLGQILLKHPAPRRHVFASRPTLTPPPNVNPATSVGLYSWAFESQNYIAQIDETQFRTIRFGGNLDPVTLDILSSHGKKIVMTIGPDRSRSACATDEQFVAGYLTLIESFLNQYGPGGTYFSSSVARAAHSPVTEIEITNEPNFDARFGPDLAARSALYAKLLIASFAFIKARWPTVTVVGFSAGGSSAAAPGFINKVHLADARVASSYDVISLHPYIQPQAPEATRIEAWGSWSIEGTINSIRRTMQTYGTQGKPLWVTEIGWQLSQASGGRFPDKYAAGLSASLQAAYSVRADVLFTKLGIARVYHMFATDTDGFNGGFYTPAGPRPIARATQQYISICRGDARAIVTISDGSLSGYWAYLVTAGDGSKFVVAWANTPVTVSLASPNLLSASRAVGMLGDFISITPAGKSVRVTLGPAPTYVLPLSSISR